MASKPPNHQGQKATEVPQNEKETGYHIPVMLHEAVDALLIKPDGVYVDCTMGGGGHSQAILQALGSQGKLFAFDQDADAANNVPNDERLIFIPQNFRHAARFLRLYGHPQVDGLLADLGVSSHQFDDASRGFSYRGNAELDMRMNRQGAIMAKDVVNSYTAKQLQQMLSKLGDVTNARTLSEAMVAARISRPFTDIQSLLDVLQPLSKGNPYRYYAQVFQALRMEVNDELGALQALLEQVPEMLKPGGRAAFITFHSGEDRVVKQFFRDGSFNPQEDPLYGRIKNNLLKPVHKKPIEPRAVEKKQNSRARSAKLRVVEKIHLPA